jgi:hypothetical protein
MSRAKPDLSPFDRIDTPDLWERITHLQPTPPPDFDKPSDRRIGTIALALGLSIVALGFLALAFFRSELQPAQPVPSPSGVEPPTPMIEETVQIGPRGQTTDMVAGFGRLWISAYGVDGGAGPDRWAILEVDPASMEVVATVPIGSGPSFETGGGGLLSTSDALWVAASERLSDHDEGALIRLDPSTGATQTFTTPAAVAFADVADDGTNLWVVGRGSNETTVVMRFDPATGTFTGPVELEITAGRQIEAVPGAVMVRGLTWEGDSGPCSSVISVDVTTLAVLAQQPSVETVCDSNIGTQGAMFVVDGRIWISSAGSFAPLDPLTARVLSSGVPFPVSAGPRSDPVVAPSGVWYGAYPGGNGSRPDTLTWMHPSTGQVRSFDIPVGWSVAAALDGSLWAMGWDGTLTKISLGTGGAENGSATPTTEAWGIAGQGWTELPAPPETLRGASLVWTGAELVLFGGTADYERSVSVAAYAFDPVAGTWSDLPDPPASAWGSQGFWTGREALFWGGQDPSDALGGVAFDPVTRTWRTIPAAPLDPGWGGQGVWTGEELIVFGGGEQVGDPRNVQAAAYDPDADTWRRLPDAPTGLNRLSGTWSGDEAMFLGSLQNLMNRAETEQAVGVAFDPSTDTWRPLAVSPLNPQAVSIAALPDGDLFAWDYEAQGATYGPSTDRWGSTVRIPLEAGECVPQTVVVERSVFAWFCAQAALGDAAAEMWVSVSGGITDATIDPGSGPIPLFQSASLTAAGPVVAIVGEGITIEDGSPCLGCFGAPATFWIFRP